MKAVFAHADQTGKYALSVMEDGKVVIYSNNEQGLTDIKTFDIDSKGAQFLPSSLGLAFISGDSKGNLTIYHKEDLKFEEYKIESFHEFTSNICVSNYPPQPRVACISRNSIVVFDLLFNEKIELLLHRKYSNSSKYLSFGFGPGNTMWAITENSLLCKFDLSMNKPEFLKIEGQPVYVSPSPVSKDTCAVLLKDGKVWVFVGKTVTEISHQVKDAKIVEWSPLGTSIAIYGDTMQEWKQTSPSVWRLSK